MSEQQTCGKGLASRAQLPQLLSDLTDALSDLLGFHQTALKLDSREAQDELRVYVSLEQRFRTISSLLQSATDEMAKARDLPMAPHDVSLLAGPEQRGHFEHVVRHERELFELLQRSIEEDTAMLERMRGH